jgi:predicted transcriptional regulator of viral defense system
MTVNSRRIPRGLAPIVEKLELNQPQIVSLSDLEELRDQADVGSSVQDIAKRLAEHGWLLPLRARGMYEFAPAARAGRYSAGDPFAELRATIARRPDLPVAVAHESSAWLHSLSPRLPSRNVLAIPSNVDVPRALSEFRIVRTRATSDPVQINKLPVWSIETLLAMMADRPSSFHDWPNVREWLNDAVNRISPVIIEREADHLSKAAVARLAYLVARGGNEEVASELIGRRGIPTGPVYFGTDRRSGVFDKRFNIIDSVLSV